MKWRLSGGGYASFIVLGAALLAAAALGALSVGAADLSVVDVVRAAAGIAGADPIAVQIVRELRLPRILGAALVGGALSAVGAALQAVMRNPLADPYVLGISSGASVGAALAAVVMPAALLGLGTSALAFVAALVSVTFVYRVALVGGRVPAVRLLLAGVAWSSFATAITGFLLYLAPEASAVRGVIFWIMGGLSGATWGSLLWASSIALPGLAVIVGSARHQTVLLLGDETALSLGLDTARVRRRLVVVSALVTGALVAFAGAIGFVGLVVPHALRPLTGPDHRRLLPAAIIYGALLVVAMDTLARTIMAPEELPVGILSGLLGAPFFLLLLRRMGGRDV